MRLPSAGLALALVLQATAAKAWKVTDGLRIGLFDDDDDDEPARVYVPTYNITMPVDHFNPSDTRTFNNRFFVNDTYYKPGGPVIFYDFGEAGVDEWYAAILLGGWNGSLSAPLELAKSRNGVVVGFEHRYYGYSRPFPVSDEEDYYAEDTYTRGTPLGGAADYKYLTVEQALEDVAYFARRFNQTHLGPYHTPWIWVGGSYPGMRGTWMRLHNPDIIYAVWASSAPVQTVADGSAYPNSVYRALPGNCTADMHAAVRRIDEIMDSGNRTLLAHLGMQIGHAQYGFDSDDSYRDFDEYTVEALTEVLAAVFENVALGYAQGYGYTEYQQVFCDILEGFDAPAYLANTSGSANAWKEDVAFLWNKGDAGPPSWYDSITPWQDAHAWEWQVLTELGLIISVNGTSDMALGSKYVDHKYARQRLIDTWFGNFSADVFPAEPDNEYTLGFGGWRMQVSNTMFTDGEFDPWRTYGVSSVDEQLEDFPQFSGLRREIPGCGVNGLGINSHFGMVYPGAVHTEDIAMVPGDQRGSQNATHPPLKQGLELFQRALDVWLPCFNGSRGQTAAFDPKNPDATAGGGNSTDDSAGDKNAAPGGRSSSAAATGVWAVVGMLSFVVYHVL
ncbi:serine carboxypeptidase S28-domain-containing protein [Coniochaeta sp. 2T2.1]|nr:serine carboxypeptidase S28-domain-containing protein [Coniochaeta sp. 2T2.1]